MPCSENGKLHYQKLGSPENEAILFLHGFMGSGAEWLPIAEALQTEYFCLLPDLPGHGRSLNLPETAYTLPGAAKMLMEMLEKEGLKNTHLVGYSMGGRLGWYLAVHYPERWKSVILENTTPGIPDEGERHRRRQEDEKLARRLERGELRHFVEAWYRLPLWQSLRGHPALPRLIRERCRNNPLELAKSLRKMGTGTQPDLRKSFERIECPVFLLTGMMDVKFYGIARELKKAFPEFHLREFPEAGHNIHFEMPEQYQDCLKQILKNKEKPMSSVNWIEAGKFTDIKYHKAEGIAKITINRPEVRNAFRPLTVMEMSKALEDAREDQEIGVIILTGEGDKAFCSGGDQKIRGDSGYKDDKGVHRLNVLDFQRQIRTCPKPVIAMVAGYAIGGGHVLHVMCDLTIAADNAIFGQTGPKVGSFDGGYGSSYLARIVGQKKAREIWFLCRQYNAQQALEMGLVNAVVPLERLEEETIQWCREILANSPTAIRCLKAAMNADCDGQAGLQELAGCATMLYYMSEEAQEGKNAFLEKRKPDFSKFGRQP